MQLAAGKHLSGVAGWKGGALPGCSCAKQVLSWPWEVTQSQGLSSSCPTLRLWGGNLPCEWSLESSWGRKWQPYHVAAWPLWRGLAVVYMLVSVMVLSVPVH